jgi:hypothetical protein
MRSVVALALLGSLAACSSALPTQTAYLPAVIEQPQPVHFYCGKLIDVEPATLNFSNEAGVGITPRRGQWLAGLHAGAYGPGGAGIKVSGGFVDLIGIASAPNLPANEYTVLLRTGTSPPDQTLSRAEPMAAVVVVQNTLPAQYPNEGQLVPGADVVVRVVGQSGRVMRSPFGGYCAGNFPWSQTASAGVRPIAPGRPGGVADWQGFAAEHQIPDWQAYAAEHLAAIAPMPIPLGGAYVSYAPADTRYHPHWDVPVF